MLAGARGLQRRSALVALMATLTGGASHDLAAASPAGPLGPIMAIGGAETLQDGSLILSRFIALSGGANARFVVCTAASAVPSRVWPRYDAALRALGVRHVDWLDLRSSEEANDPAAAARIAQAEGIWLTGGDQSRLMQALGGSRCAAAIARAANERGACVAGTSAGAAALSRQMLARGSTPRLPEKHAAQLAAGLGLIPGAIVDQHFSERRRLGRLLSVIAQHPDQLGVGIDEDTALIISRRREIEVIGSGAVTLVDGRRMRSNYSRIEASDPLEMLGLRLHVLIAGSQYSLNPPGESGTEDHPASLLNAVSLLASA